MDWERLRSSTAYAAVFTVLLVVVVAGTGAVGADYFALVNASVLSLAVFAAVSFALMVAVDYAEYLR